MSKDKITVKEMKHDGLVDAVATTTTFMRKYRGVFFILGGVVIIVAVIIAAVISHSASVKEKAEQALNQARSRDQLQAVYEEYPDTPSAPLALIQLGAVQYDGNEYVQALESYQLFLKSYRAHRLADFARMGIAYCRESEGKWDAAIQEYRNIENAYPNSSLAAEAALNIGRCQARQGQIQIALISYRDVLERFPQSMYAALAREELVDLLYRSLRDENARTRVLNEEDKPKT